MVPMLNDACHPARYSAALTPLAGTTLQMRSSVIQQPTVFCLTPNNVTTSCISIPGSRLTSLLDGVQLIPDIPVGKIKGVSGESRLVPIIRETEKLAWNPVYTEMTSVILSDAVDKSMGKIRLHVFYSPFYYRSPPEEGGHRVYRRLTERLPINKTIEKFIGPPRHRGQTWPWRGPVLVLRLDAGRYLGALSFTDDDWSRLRKFFYLARYT